MANNKPRIVAPLMHEIRGLNTCIGTVIVEDDTITWRFQGRYGEETLEAVRQDLIRAAQTGGHQVFDLMTPFKPRERG